MWAQLGLLLILSSAFGLAVKLPEVWPICKSGSGINDCLRNAIETAIRNLEKGNRTLGVPPLDPWNIKSFNYQQNSGPLHLTVGANDINILGFKNSIIDMVKNDWKKMEIYIRTGKLSLDGDYFLNGTVLYLPIKGNGKFLLTLDNYRGILQLHFDKFTKKGKEYFKIRDSEIFVDCSQMRFRFENLFNGNKRLGDRMNDILNNNWRILLDSIAPLAARALGEPVKLLSNELFSRIPADSIVPK